MTKLLPLIDWNYSNDSVDSNAQQQATFLFWNDGFCFVVSNEKQQIVSIEVKHASQNWDVIFLEQALEECKSICVNVCNFILVDDKLLLIPISLFNEEEATLWFMKLNHLGNSETVYFDDVPKFKLKVAYSYLDTFNRQLQQAFGASASAKHLSSLVLNIEDFASENQNIEVQLFILDNIGAFNIVSKGKLLIHQVFKYNSIEDVAYKLVLVSEQHNLDANNLNVNLMGIHNEIEDFAEDLKLYFPNTVIVSGNDGPAVYFLNKLLECV